MACGSYGSRLPGRLTDAVISSASQFMNTVDQYEIDLRGKIWLIGWSVMGTVERGLRGLPGDDRECAHNGPYCSYTLYILRLNDGT